MLAEIKEGIRYVRATRWLRAGLVAAGIANAIMFSPMAVLLPFLLRHTLHDSKVVVGYTFAVMGFSGALGALVASNLRTPRRPRPRHVDLLDDQLTLGAHRGLRHQLLGGHDLPARSPRRCCCSATSSGSR